jgi:hypothetical protein
VAFEAEVDPATARICHCTDCQITSGSLFRTNIAALDGTFRLIRGTPRNYVKTAESGNKRAQVFCGDCGSGLYSTQAVDPVSYVLRVGVIAERAAFRPSQQIWCRSALPWGADVPGLPKREGQ